MKNFASKNKCKNDSAKMIEHMDNLRAAAKNIRSLAYLMTAHDSSVGIPIAINVWSHIGQCIENWSMEITALSTELENYLHDEKYD